MDDENNEVTEPVAAPEETDAEKSLEARLELVASFALLTVSALKKVIHERGAGALEPEQLQKLEAARTEVQTAIAALESWTESDEGRSASLNLTGLQGKLRKIASQLDVWPVDPDTPPS